MASEPEGGEAPHEIDFVTFVMSLAASVMLSLGEHEDGTSGGPVNLPLAKQTIELLSLLQTKTRGNLTAEEGRTLEHVIYDLRMKYIKVSSEKRS